MIIISFALLLLQVVQYLVRNHRPQLARTLQAGLPRLLRNTAAPQSLPAVG